MPPSRSRASSVVIAIGSSERLPLVQTTGRPTAASSRWCSGVYGSMTPRYGLPGATSAAMSSMPRHRASRRKSRIGACGDSSAAASSAETSQRRPDLVERGEHHGQRLVGPPLPLAQPRRRPADRRSRRHSSWNPPSPLRATIRPASDRLDRHVAAPRAARRPGARRVEQFAAAARTRGQAIGWAWKRRSAGSSYSRPAGRAHREAGHRGPRPVVGQLLDDRPPRAAVRAVGERIAVAPFARRADLFAGTPHKWPDRPGSPAAGRPCLVLLRIANSRGMSSRQGLCSTSSWSIRACGGCRRLRMPTNSSSVGAGPCTSIRTVGPSFFTQPSRPRARAALYTNGRKPTPWTTPRTVIEQRAKGAFWVAGSFIASKRGFAATPLASVSYCRASVVSCK